MKAKTSELMKDTLMHGGWRIGIFFVRLVRKGDTYGRDDCLTHDEDEPLVEFYDSRYPHTPRGQFISSYYLSVFMGASDGIDLYGGEPEWKATAEEVKQLQQWILYEEYKALQAERDALVEALRDLLDQLESVGIYIPGEDLGQWAGTEGLSFTQAEAALATYCKEKENHNG